MHKCYTICVNDVETLCDHRGMIIAVYDYRSRQFTQLLRHLKDYQQQALTEWKNAKDQLLI